MEYSEKDGCEMIISASRRTDIPALYPEWFVNRLKAGEVLVPNPYNRKKIKRVFLSPETVDCIVFWTKNPTPMLPYLREIEDMGYEYYFQVTITDYEEDMEVNLADTSDVMASFLLMSERLGKERMDWRFDPLLLSEKYTIAYHLEQFELMCRWLAKATTRCIISFVDAYKDSPFRELTEDEILKLACGLSKIARSYNLPLYTCAEKINLERFGIGHSACIDKAKIRSLTGYRLDLKKDGVQRKECRCVESVDIGMYHTCIHGCRYCYATGSQENARNKYEQHDPDSPLLVGHVRGDEVITERAAVSGRDIQISLFDLPEMYTGF
ncbi:DUF1848 domain-containing protein [Sporofaciens musculi]|nr:DUF1848 domain-containing protein [Sporofaciens musculi]